MMTLAPRPPHMSTPPLRAIGLALLISAVLLQPRGADAAIAPQFLPERDIEAQYTVTVPGQPPHDYDLSFSAQSQRLRIDDPARGLWFLADLRNASAALVVPQFHAVVTMPDLTNLLAILESVRAARFTPLGQATIAGRRCTRYSIQSEQANGTACLTGDGVALAVSGQDSRGSAEAVADSVTEATVPPDRLAPPPDFSTITLPQGVIAALLGK